MVANSFGTLFRLTTWGESHGSAIGGVVDGCPSGIEISEKEIQAALDERRPGTSNLVSPRKEPDRVEILSGVYEGVTTGAPISLLIRNVNQHPKDYSNLKTLYRPGHASYTYHQKYGHFDHRGGGRSSGRETAVRVAAGAIARKFLQLYQVDACAYLSQVGDFRFDQPLPLEKLRSQRNASQVKCPDPHVSDQMEALITEVLEEGDSIGGIVECVTSSLPVGLGEPVYQKLEARLADSMLSIPASKGFEIGAGFSGAMMRGSEHNDLFDIDERGKVVTHTNNGGGTLGGISNGMPLSFRVAFKPPSSIKKRQKTLDHDGKKVEMELTKSSRHDPCIAIRACVVVEAMTLLTLADLILLRQASGILVPRLNHDKALDSADGI
ncbi:MAG: Chorismate synthase [Chlamydiia bacterium]|nr:Chorismate synthase [Chlamydiia bacterium]